MHAIEVFADIWCPFAHAGLRAVVARRNELGRADVPLVIRAWPLELVNDGPQDPDEAAAHVADIKAESAPHLFTGFDPARFPRTTVPALSLAAAAYRYTAPIGERVSLALRDALWEEGLDVSDPEVLQAIADAHQVAGWGPEDERSIREDWEAGKARGVEGSPHFFCGSVDAFCPSVDIEKADEGHLHVHRDPAKLDAFLAACLAS
jgi:predicted DsbA family dithiol-disulfide isomerase